MDSHHSRSISQGISFTGAFSPTSSRGQGLNLSSVLRCHETTIHSNNNNSKANELPRAVKTCFVKPTVRRVNNPALEGSSVGPEQVTAGIRNLAIGSDKKRMKVQQQDRWMGASARVHDPVFTLSTLSPPLMTASKKKFDSSLACFSDVCHSRVSSTASLPEIMESSQTSSASETEPWRSLGRSTRSPTRRYKRRSPLSDSGRPENPHARVLRSFRSAE